MKAISLWQPWASLWVCGRKKFETRSWSTNYGGRLLVHAAKRVVSDIPDELYAICEEEFGLLWEGTLPTGALIGVCDRVVCITTEAVLETSQFRQSSVDDEEAAMGNFAPGRFAWDPFNMRELDKLVPFRGMQGLFTVPDALIAGAA